MWSRQGAPRSALHIRVFKKVRKKVLLTLLRDARWKADVRQVDLAKALGQPQSYVSKYESGERRLDLVELQDICRALNVPLASLVRRFEKATAEVGSREIPALVHLWAE